MAIVVADDQERERGWLVDLLRSNFAEHGPFCEAENGQQAIDLVRAKQPSVVFLDIEMPIVSGIKSAEQIASEFPQTPIVILSNHSDEIFVRKLWRVIPSDGAFGYILKDSIDNQVIDATRAVLSGDCWIHPRIQRIARRNNGSTALTDSEFEVLACIAIGFTDKAIAKRLYITNKAVQARLKGLYTKLGIPLKGTSEDDEYNHRCRALNLTFRRGLINKAELEEWENQDWD